ncbi:hypothetical protein FSP39_015599 [Pinctada imbricata]|uniref:F-box/LRR-repeat protein 15-like leucin rich repeat domain-containing protein n=1 Tax=Pinctada imbricata TaxID=66713 RepID=A0AA89BUY3_PINIB|nr:hypothetical protein FSP39_015599 [Pinctada imbricata]
MVKLLYDICLNCIKNSLGQIPNVGQRLPRVLKEELLVQLTDHDMFKEDYVKIISKQLFTSELKHVSLTYCDQITDELLKLLASSGCKLKSLALSGCKNVTDNGVKAATENQDELECIDLNELPQLTSKGLKSIKSPTLTHVNLKMCPNITSEGVRIIVQNNKNIKEIRLAGRGISKLDDSVYFAMADGLGNTLEYMKSGPHTMSDDSLKVIAVKCSNLKEVNLHGCTRLTGEAIIALSQGCTSMTSLDLSYCIGLRGSPSNQCLWTLPTSLTELSLCGVGLEDETLLVECLQRLKKLKSVRLCGIPALNDKTLELILSDLGENLLDLDLSGGSQSSLTDLGLESITKYCTKLRSINLSMCHQFNGISLIRLFKDQSRAGKLEKLFFSCRKIEYDVLLAAVENCVNLEHLDMAGLKIVTDDLLSKLAEHCPRLGWLGIKGCSQVTDEGLCNIARCCDLKTIVLSGLSSITDKAIFCIANHCHHLEEIYMNGCSKISQTTLNYLMDCCIKRLYIQHVTPNVIPDQLMAKNLDTGEFCRADLLTY